MSIPPPPQTQARASSTFKVPVLDGSVTLPEIFDWQASNSPNHPLFVYGRDDGTKRTVFWPEAVRAAHTGARLVRELTGGVSGQVVALLAASDTISYFTMTMSIMRADCIAFPISPRNSATAVAHLLNKVNVAYLLVGREQALVDLASQALEVLAKSEKHPTPPIVSPIPLFEDLFLPQNTPNVETALPYSRKPTDIAWYLHSSGSTAFPKPIPWTHTRLIQVAIIPWFGERDLTGLVLSLAVMPMYHGMGTTQLCWTAACGLTLSAFEPKSPAQIPTAEGLFNSAKATNSDLIFCVPTFIEAWRHKPDYVKWLATRTGVLYSGGPLNKELGDYITSQGVSIFMLYGATEAGFMSTILPKEVDYDWNYLKFSGLVTAEMVPYDDGTYEFVMVENPYCRPSVINTKVNGRDAYASSDLLVPHPTKPGYWRIHGRTDDQIMHSTGEKTNPGPLENIMNQHPKVLSSVMFGRGRFQAGMIIDPKPEFRFEPNDLGKLASFRNEIWPIVKKLNDYAPQHSRLFKEMIIFSKSAKPFTYTAKGTARRQAIILDYEEEVEQLYDTVDESTQTSIPAPTTWDPNSTLNFVRNVVLQVVQDKSINDHDDLFEHGCDSLQATWIRNSLLRALRDSAELDTRKRTDNFVYKCPAISGLATYVFEIASGMDDQQALDTEKKVEEMHTLVKKFSIDLSKPVTSTEPESSEEVVVLVGSTGAIGSQALVALAKSDKVQHVYALNRRNPETSLKERQKKAFTERALPLEVLESPKVSLLEVDFQSHHLGLDVEVHDKIQQTVTRVIYSAWRVDFNLALTSFESNIKALRKVGDFALRAPRLCRFIFVSSIGVLQNTTGVVGPVKEAAVAAEVALGTGYSESKWVAEAVLEEVRKTTGLPTLVVRLGQVAGAVNGTWNVKEWFPSLVQASKVFGSLPNFETEKLISWIPAEAAGQCLSELIYAPANLHFTHLVHPRPVPWNTIVSVLSAELQLDLAPYATWLEKLETSSRRDRLNAAVLLPFFKLFNERQSQHEEAFGFPTVEAVKALSCCQTLKKLEPLSERKIRSWIAYWHRVGII